MYRIEKRQIFQSTASLKDAMALAEAQYVNSCIHSSSDIDSLPHRLNWFKVGDTYVLCSRQTTDLAEARLYGWWYTGVSIVEDAKDYSGGATEWLKEVDAVLWYKDTTIRDWETLGAPVA